MANAFPRKPKEYPKYTNEIVITKGDFLAPFGKTPEPIRIPKMPSNINEKPTETFSLFPELPKELQIEVWKHATDSAMAKGSIYAMFLKTTQAWGYVPFLQGPYSGKIIYVKEDCYSKRDGTWNRSESGFEILLDTLQACSLSRVVTLERMKSCMEAEAREFPVLDYRQEDSKRVIEVSGELVEQMHQGNRS